MELKDVYFGANDSFILNLLHESSEDPSIKLVTLIPLVRFPDSKVLGHLCPSTMSFLIRGVCV